MEAIRPAIIYTLASFVLVWPLLVMVEAGRKRILVLAVSVAGAVGGALYAFVPSASRVSVENVLIKGGTMWAGLCLLLAVLDVTGLAVLRRRHPGLQLSVILCIAATALPLNGLALVRDILSIVFLKEGMTAWLYAGAAVAVSVSVCMLASRYMSRLRVAGYVTLWSYLLVAPVVRVALQPFIMPSIESIIARIAHDAVHVLIMMIQLPDHLYLTDIMWVIIGFVFQKSTGVLLNIAVYVGVVLYVVLRQMAIPLPVREGESPPDRRRRWVRLKTQRRIAVTPVAIAVIWFTWSAYAGWAADSAPVTPTPVPLPAGGIETATLADNRLHSFVFGQAKDKRVIAILKADGSYSVCLDACLVCAPDGYAQLGSDLFCLYCGTPIPIATVGVPGGCNPIPVEFSESGDRLIFDEAAAEKAWEEANTGK